MFQTLHSWDNLLLAYRKAAKGKRGKGNVAAFERILEDHLFALQSDLIAGGYQPGAYHSFYIHDPKRRLISAAPFRDRVVHHALCNLIEPVFERSFIADSYANRIGKGTHRALDRVQQFTRRFDYVLQLDVKKFFPAIDHDILLRTLKKTITDPQIIALCRQIIASGKGVLHEEYEMQWFLGDDLLAAVRPRGLPIGNLTSQFWANVYLNSFDHFVKRELRCKGYVRYVDDFVLFSNSKKELWDWKMACEKRLAQLRLTVHVGSHPKPVTEGVSFLGWRVFRHSRRLKQRNVRNYQRKFDAHIAQYNAGVIMLEDLNISVAGWVNHARYGNTVGIRKRVLARQLSKYNI